MNQISQNTVQNTTNNVLNNISQNQGDSGRVALLLKKNYIGEIIRQMNYQFGHVVSMAVQGIFYPIFFVFYHTFFNLTINGKDKLKNIKEPVIFISNHISSYDSFVFDLFVPPFSRIPPFRFMATTKVTPWYLRFLKYTGILHLIYLFFGVIKVTYGNGAEIATIPAADIIERGGTVAIFPEGKIWTLVKDKDEKDLIGPFKWGAAFLARNTNALVVPVSFRRGKDGLFRRKLVVNIGEPYKINPTDRPEVVTDDMRCRVIDLYKKV